jgi:hypothetical protein
MIFNALIFRKCIVKNSITDFQKNPAYGLVIDNRSEIDGDTGGWTY